MAARIQAAIGEYAADAQSRANNVTQLAASTAKRLRVGGFRTIFEETEIAIVVTKTGPRSSTYE